MKPLSQMIGCSTSARSSGLAPSENPSTVAQGLAKARCSPAINESAEPQMCGAKQSLQTSLCHKAETAGFEAGLSRVSSDYTKKPYTCQVAMEEALVNAV
jgi:hypothetical protein